MEREEPTIHSSGEHVPVRDLVDIASARWPLVRFESRPEAVWLGSAVLPDLSVPPEAEMALLRSGWAGVIEIELPQTQLQQHTGIESLVESHLQGRMAAAEVIDGTILVDMQVEDDSEETRARVRDFAVKLKALLGRHAKRLDVRFITLEPDVMEGLLEDYKPRLRAL